MAAAAAFSSALLREAEACLDMDLATTSTDRPAASGGGGVECRGHPLWDIWNGRCPTAGEREAQYSSRRDKGPQSHEY
jgi:hypothetical protein